MNVNNTPITCSSMLKMSFEQIIGVVRGLFMYWDPKLLTIPTYVCMGIREKYLEERKELLDNVLGNLIVVVTNSSFYH